MTRTNKFGILWAGLVLALCASPLQATLIAHYTFDETTGTAAGDSSTDGTDHGGIVKGTTFDAGSTTGMIGNALTLDGSTDYVQLEGGGAVQASGTALQLSNFTLAIWFKRTGAGSVSALSSGNQANPLITKGRNEGDSPAARNTNYFLGVRPDGKLQGHFEQAAGADQHLIGATAVANDVWHHAAMTYDGTTMRLYLDGSEDVSQAFGVAANSASTMFAAIGSALNQSGTTSGFFEGQIDDARIYDTVLTESEIGALVPEPTSSLLAVFAMVGFVGASRRKRK